MTGLQRLAAYRAQNGRHATWPVLDPLTLLTPRQRRRHIKKLRRTHKRVAAGNR